MNGNCHFVFGATVGSMIALNIDSISNILPNIANTQETVVLFVMGGVLGGILPDIDNPSSHIGQLSIPISSIIGKINDLLGKKGANHRGILHDPTIYIIGLILSYMFCPALLGLFVGCLSHIFLDLFNPKGVPCLIFKRISLANIKSGSNASIIFTWICVFINLAIGILINCI